MTDPDPRTSNNRPPVPGSTAVPTGADAEPTAAEEAAAEAEVDPPQKEWWEDQRLPWQGAPRKVDKQCWAAIALLGVYGMVLLPLRPILLGLDSYVLATVTGSNIAMADIGAKAATGPEPWWWVALLVAAATSVKFDWIFWWAGKLWGRGIIEVMAGRSKWAARTGAAAERLARKFGGPAIFLAWFIPFLPGAIVAAFVGDVGMRLRRYMLIDFFAALCYRGLWMYLGYQIGEPAKDLVKVIAKYANYFAIAMLVFIVVGTFIRTRREQQAKAS
ncbi:VTT domain-containing protein [Yimella sp. cx-573]|nr:VTT domain-containing protein [Yimella sp. cx-573]